ncbi:FUSC family protein [Roseixanthobacter glucoisosaccharinicivorans]|uniref:FUSC family protein n=1 Tax=Roseixanthobacter glucoisosaccharinicivorans TaxID=3119923 RepID=UPI0037269448
MPHIDPAHLRLAVRATVAAAVAFLLAWLLHMPKGYWAVLTAILVVQSSIGASLAVAVDRCLGTLAGGALGVALAMLAGPSFSLTFALLLLGTFLSAFLAARNPSFKLAPVTVVIVMLADPTHAEPWISGLERVFEIALGGAVGLACALLVLPDKALGYLFPHVADALEASADLLEAGIAALLDGGLDPARMDALNHKVRVTLRAADVRAGEARRERLGPFSAAPDPGPIVRGGRRLWHSVIILLRGADRPLPPAVAEQVRPVLSAAAQALGQGVRGIASALRGGPAPVLAATDAAVAALQAELERLASSGALAGEGASLMQLYGAAAGCAYIHDNLNELAARLAEARKDAA